MEPLSSFAISIAAGIALDIYNNSESTVEKELKKAFEKALKQWSPNKGIRDARRSIIKTQLSELFKQPEQLLDVEITKPKLSRFLKKYSKILPEYPVAYNYIKEIKDDHRFKKEVILLEDIYSTVVETNNKLTKLVDVRETQKKRDTNSTTKIIEIRKHGVISDIFEKELNKLKNSMKYQMAIELIIEKFPSYPSWELLLEFLKFCELASKPNFGIKHFQKFRLLLGINPTDKQKEQNDAINYYLGRLYTQNGNYQEAFLWHMNNSVKKTTRFFQLLSRFEMASLHFRTENFLLALKEYEITAKLFESIEHSIFLKIHVFLYLATVHVIKVIYNVPNLMTCNLVNPNPQKSIEYSNKALKLINDLKFEDDKNDKYAWVYLTLAFGEESRGNFDKAYKYYSKSEELILSGKINVSSITHILLYSAKFYRRNQEYQKAIKKIKLIRKLLPISKRKKIEASLYEEVSCILFEYGKKKLSKIFFEYAISLFKEEPSIEMKMHWPIVERLSKSCKDLNIKF